MDEGLQFVEHDIRRPQLQKALGMARLGLSRQVENLPVNGPTATAQHGGDTSQRNSGHGQGQHLLVQLGPVVAFRGEGLSSTEILSARLTLIPRHRLMVVLGTAIAFLPIETRRRVYVVDASGIRAPGARALHGRTVAAVRVPKEEAFIPCGLKMSGNARA